MKTLALISLSLAVFAQDVTVVPGGRGTVPGGTGGSGSCPTCVVTTTSYSNPAWITALAGSKITGAISGASGSLNTTFPSNYILYGNGNGLPTTDQYWKYTPTPGSPVAGNTFNRLSLTNANTFSDPYLTDDSQNTFANSNGITTLSFTKVGNFPYYNNFYNYIWVSPSANWNIAGNKVTVSAERSNVYVPNTSTNGIFALNGVAGQVENYGSGNVENLSGLNYTGYHGGSGTLTTMTAIYAYSTTYGFGNATNVRGIDMYSGHDGYAAGTLTTHIGLSVGANKYGNIATSYNIKTRTDGSGTITTAWDISAETGFNNRFMGKTLIGPNNSTAPTDTLDIQDNTATTGATRVGIYLGAADSASTTTFTNAGTSSSVHYKGGGSAPSITSGFGSSPSIAGTDTAGRVTVGTGGVAATGTITFAVAFTTAPSCHANDESTQLPVFATATTTTLVIAASSPFSASDKLTYACVGY